VVQIFGKNARARGRWDIRGLVTIVAACGGVLAGEWKPRLAMVNRFAVRLPANQWKIGAIVLGMANCAVLASRVRCNPHRVHAAPLRNPLANLHVAIEALELHFPPAKRVAFRAAEHTRQRFMRLG